MKLYFRIVLIFKTCLQYQDDATFIECETVLSYTSSVEGTCSNTFPFNIQEYMPHSDTPGNALQKQKLAECVKQTSAKYQRSISWLMSYLRKAIAHRV